VLGSVCRMRSSSRPSVVGTQTSSIWIVEFLQDHSGHQSGGLAAELLTQGRHQTVGEKGDEQVRFDD